MTKLYNPLDWYWLKPDGESVYSSKRQQVVAASDVDYLAWAEDGTTATPWPKDETGAQTDASLQAVLAGYGLALPGHIAVPTSVSSAQAKIQCLRTAGSAAGKTMLDDITAAVQGQGGEAKIWFDEARTWERSNIYVAALSKGLGLSTSQVDMLFVEAAQIAA